MRTYYPAKLNVYVTVSVSPDTTTRSPGEPKSAAENNVPAVPLLALPLVKNAPPIVVEPLILNTAGEAVLVTTDGFAVVAAAKVATTRVALL